MELDAALPPTEVRLNTSLRQYAFRLAKLAPNYPVNKWANTHLYLPPDLHSPTQLERIKDSISGLVEYNLLEPLKYFNFAL